MTQLQRPSIFLLLLSVLLLAIPTLSAQEVDRTPTSDSDPLFYLFSARQLDSTTGLLTVRFQYSTSERIIGFDERTVSFDGAQALLVSLPDSLWSRLLLRGEEDVRVEVFADDTLLADFDYEQLLAYNRILAYTQPAEWDLRSMQEKIVCGSPCEGGCGPYDDYDCDGVNNITDNCTDDYNPNQADCDSDGIGDVCDVTNGTYQTSGGVETCMTDRDEHTFYKTFEHHVEQRYVDTSACNAPDQWSRWVRADRNCDYTVSDYNCCQGLQPSLSAVGDTYTYWCASGVRNIDFCH